MILVDVNIVYTGISSHSHAVMGAAQRDEPQQHKGVHWSLRGARTCLLPDADL